MRKRLIDGEPCRVAHVSLQLDMGGMEKLLVEFARHADRTRYHLDFISLTGRGVLADEIESLGWKVYAMDKRPGVRPTLLLSLSRLFRRLGTCVVHAHNTPTSFYALPAAKLARTQAAILTRHGQGPAPGSWQGRKLAWFGRLADWIVGVSKDSSARAVQSGLPAGRVVTIWNGIDLERFPFRGPAANGPAILVARLAPEKNVDTLLRALPSVIQQAPQFRLQVLGDGPCRRSLEALSDELGLGKHVAFLGQTSNVEEHLRQASMFVFPSLTEGISLTLLEAMSTGLPVIATPVGGNVEIVVDGETGLMAGPTEPQQLAQAILRLLKNQELGSRMGVAGRQRVESLFDVRVMVRTYETLYADCLTKNGR